MHAMRSVLAGALLAAAGATALAGTLTVNFVQPETYGDAAYSRPVASERDRAQVQRDIEQHLQRLAERNLAAHEALRIDILDIDLAGHFEPFGFRSADDVRVIRDIAWPRIKLRYTLARDGEAVASAEEQVSDMNYLVAAPRYPMHDRLRYERAMLDDWFGKRFGRR